MARLFSRLLEPPAKTFLLLGPRGTGKSTWLSKHFPQAVRIDLLHTEQHEGFQAAAPAWLSLPWQGEAAISHSSDPDGTAVTSLLLPGLAREQLQVQRAGHALQVRLGPLRRGYPLPGSCLDRTPCGAKVVGRHLEVRFR